MYVGLLGLIVNLAVMLIVYAVVKVLNVKVSSRLTPQELV